MSKLYLILILVPSIIFAKIILPQTKDKELEASIKDINSTLSLKDKELEASIKDIPNKVYLYFTKTKILLNSSSAKVIFVTPEFTISKGKHVDIDITVLTRNNGTRSWGGIFVNINIFVDGKWTNLGNEGYQLMVDKTKFIGNYAKRIILTKQVLDRLGIKGRDHKVRIELLGASYTDTTIVNSGKTDFNVNTTYKNLGKRGKVDDLLGSFNYTHIYIKEFN